MSNRHPGTTHLLSLFAFEHLPHSLQLVSRDLHDVAHSTADKLADGPELTTGLRKLLEAKDCFVRQAVIDLKASSEPPPVNSPETFLTQGQGHYSVTKGD